MTSKDPFKFKVVQPDRHNGDEYLQGFYPSRKEAQAACKKGEIVKRTNPVKNDNPAETDYDHYLFSLIPEREYDKVMESDALAEIGRNLMTCDTKFYFFNSLIVPKGHIVIDIGCGYNAQSYLYTKHKANIGVEPGPGEHFRAPGTAYFQMTGQRFIQEVLPRLIARGLDLKRTFAICHFVPDEECQELVRKTFPGCYVYYPDGTNKETIHNETYYQPVIYSDDGTNIAWGKVPNGMYDHQVFRTREAAKTWLKDNGFDPKDYAIIKYNDDDIEDRVYLD